MISVESVERAISEIKQEVKGYKWDERYFEKFIDAPYDREVLGYFKGDGGYYLKFLALLTRKLNLSNILELGNYAGASTVAIYAGMSPAATLTTVDIVKDQRYCTDEMRKDSSVRFVIGDALDLSAYGEQAPTDIDFLYEDTFHYYDHIRDIFEIYEPLLADKALVAIDDINDNDKRKFFDELPYEKWDLTELCHYGGWGLVLFERKQPRSAGDRLRDAYCAAMRIWKRRHDKKAEILDKLEVRKPGNILRSFLHRRKKLHSLVLTAKKLLGIIPCETSAFDERRFYSGGREKEMEHLRKNVLQNEGRKR